MSSCLDVVRVSWESLFTSAVDTTIPATAILSIISTDATEINLTLYLSDFFLKLGARYTYLRT
jgi:hypothetical protein